MMWIERHHGRQIWLVHTLSSKATRAKKGDGQRAKLWDEYNNSGRDCPARFDSDKNELRSGRNRKRYSVKRMHLIHIMSSRTTTNNNLVS
eukprot:scaffold10025_cov180-Amphora_coffeaeformis.AAC.6